MFNSSFYFDETIFKKVLQYYSKNSENLTKMNQVFLVRCSLCKRVFCCLKHRHDHERRDHAMVSVTPVMLIRRRFRAVAPVTKKLQAASVAAVLSTNSRKRHRTPVDENERPSMVDSGVRLKETPVRRNVLRAYRPSLASVKDLLLRPVAESSPTIPYTPYTSTSQGSSTENVEGAATPAASLVDSPSFYHTPMQQTPNHPVMSDGTPASQKAKKRVSFCPESSAKGFFWSNVARRVRMALRPAKPKSIEKSPSPTINCVDTVRYYNNIQPRRPINEDVILPEVEPRPPLEAIRKAHEAAVKATLSTSTES
ncbi:uncharacterized protein LOC126897463 isoform X2 [Daktulosphaira vitifoliae]|uniref:uncharacterized protein LOC126897463 isoform X2 n=1 Tax=Daktulosphaira vitifoliae TaxID=58002 RepID=UPI0021A9978F|nr:uncharacterized protein LOC126897463 isoform X2 [Daktulosphaira vitifoliae]